jgi:hypothetical protein
MRRRWLRRSLRNRTVSHLLSASLAVVSWELWSVGAIGLFVGGLIFLVGRSRVAARDTAAPEGDAAGDRRFHGNTLDRRSAPRRRGNDVAVFLTAKPDAEDPLLGVVVDRSLGGLCVLVERPLQVDAVLHVRVRSSTTVPWTPVRVKTCRQCGSEWEAGCQFLQTPVWNVLMLFG